MSAERMTRRDAIIGLLGFGLVGGAGADLYIYKDNITPIFIAKKSTVSQGKTVISRANEGSTQQPKSGKSVDQNIKPAEKPIPQGYVYGDLAIGSIGTFFIVKTLYKISNLY